MRFFVGTAMGSFFVTIMGCGGGGLICFGASILNVGGPLTGRPEYPVFGFFTFWVVTILINFRQAIQNTCKALTKRMRVKSKKETSPKLEKIRAQPPGLKI